MCERRKQKKTEEVIREIIQSVNRNEEQILLHFKTNFIATINTTREQ